MSKKLGWMGTGVVVLIVGALFWTANHRHSVVMKEKESRNMSVTTPGGPSNTEMVQAVKEAMSQLGYQQEGLTAQNWGGDDCAEHAYFVRPNSQANFLAVKNHVTGEVKTLTFDQANTILHRHIAFNGGLYGSSLSMSNGQRYFLLGNTLDEKAGTFVYIRFDQNACGIVVDQVVYRSPWETKTVPVQIQLLP